MNKSNSKALNLFLYLMTRYGKWIPDYFYLKLYSKLELGKSLDIKNPRTFNDKINWLKLYNRNPKLITCADKYKVRDYIKSTIGEKYLVPILWSGNDANNIPFDTLPNSFVLKTNNSSGTNIIVENKENMNKENIIRQMNYWIKQNYYYSKREWAYKEIPPLIIVEKFLKQGEDKELRDYRFFCFNGKPQFISVDFSITDKSKTRRNLYDLSWNILDAEISYPKDLDIIVDKPDKLAELIELSKTLADGFPHVRIDYYYINGHIYFGEMTFYHQSGMAEIFPQEFNETMGNWIDITN